MQAKGAAVGEGDGLVAAALAMSAKRKTHAGVTIFVRHNAPMQVFLHLQHASHRTHVGVTTFVELYFVNQKHLRDEASMDLDATACAAAVSNRNNMGQYKKTVIRAPKGGDGVVAKRVAQSLGSALGEHHPLVYDEHLEIPRKQVSSLYRNT